MRDIILEELKRYVSTLSEDKLKTYKPNKSSVMFNIIIKYNPSPALIKEMLIILYPEDNLEYYSDIIKRIKDD